VTRILDQQFVAHVFASADGPDADAAYRALEDVWRGCGLLFGMTDPIPGIGLPSLIPARAQALPELRADAEVALAAAERPGANWQIVLRVHHDVLNLSVALAPPEAAAAVAGGWTWWRDYNEQWCLLTAQHAPHMLGEVRLYLARIDAEAEIQVAAPGLYERLSRLLPADVPGPPGQSTGVSRPAGLALWEAGTEPDERRLRQFVLAIAPDADPAASAWAWSRGDTAIPPLARYLLHAAKIRYELRVWQRDSQARQLRTALDAVGDEFRRLGASGPAGAELQRLSRNALLLGTELRKLRRTVEIAADNLGRAFDLTGMLTPGSPFADDANLARSMLERLDDEVAYLDLDAERAGLSGNGLVMAAKSPPAEDARPAEDPWPSTHGMDTDLRRNVFVVYGRDDQARRAIFDFLRALGLRPLEWEMLVGETRNTSPFLAEAVRRGLAQTRAVIVLMTPEDVVRLHPDLHDPGESAAETRDAMQARPNVLLELGMALAVHPNATLILMIGEQRPITDLGGVNFVRITDTPGCRRKIAGRLQMAGCLVDDSGTDWLFAGNFADLAALHRAP
jgi:predicted nucleotide-binding protein